MVGWLGVSSLTMMNVTSPKRLLPMITATAPAVCAFRNLVENVQPPRVIRAILPVRLPAASAEHAVFSPLMPDPVTTFNGAVSGAATFGNSPGSPAYVPDGASIGHL